MAEMTNKRSRIKYISVLNALACFAVVMLHSNGAFWTYSTDSYWISADFIESFMYFAVPVFFMISGTTLIDYRDKYSTREYFKKRIEKTLIPFIAWSVIGAFYQYYAGRLHIDWTVEGVKTLIAGMMNTHVITVYWFFIYLFSIYLCIPPLAAIPKTIRKEVFKYCAAVSFLLQILVPFICNITKFNYGNGVTFFIGEGYMFYIFAGWLIKEHEFTKKEYAVTYVLGIIGFLLHFLGTYLESAKAGCIVQTYKGYTNLPAVLYSIAVFVLVKQLSEKINENGRAYKLICRFARYTFAIYLIHWFILDLMTKVLNLDKFLLCYRIGMPFIVIPLCIILAFLLRKVPIIKRIVP